MGKRYWSELDLLNETYAWARTVEADDLHRLRDDYGRHPLLAVGSGGSFSSAVLAAYLHRFATGRVATAVTPLEIVHSPLDLRLSSVLFLTAGGGNPDVLGAFRKSAAKEPARLGILCMKKNSPLARASREFSNLDQFEFKLPAGKDGFLATNSLLATAVLVARGYQTSHDDAGLPDTLAEVAYGGQSPDDYLSWLETASAPLWERETLVVLYGPSSHAAAVDLESKFTEAALGQIQLADYRNFAHGRHHWLAKNGDTTAVLGFVTDDVRDVAEKTLKLIPASVPMLQIDLGAPGPAAAIAGIVNTLQLVGLVGKALDFDPGRPHVPAFGRKIYHLKAFPASRRRKSDPSPIESVAIERKLQSMSPEARLNGHVAEWRESFRTFTRGLCSQRFGALVCDYDGTLCDQAARFTGPRTEVVDHLRSLLKAGVILGIASGRGSSLRNVLREHIDRRYWDRVILGYYNGAEIASLPDDSAPNNQARAGRQLSSMAKTLARDEYLADAADVDVREKQISIVPRTASQTDVCWDRVQAALSQQSTRGLRTFRSGHSVDVVAPAVSKRNLVQEVRDCLADPDLSILCIGDRGRWPGNDSELLLEPYSLSVDEVSSASDSCWNLASPGIRYVDAVLEYFGRFAIRKSWFQVSVTEEDVA